MLSFNDAIQIVFNSKDYPEVEDSPTLYGYVQRALQGVNTKICIIKDGKQYDCSEELELVEQFEDELKQSSDLATFWDKWNKRLEVLEDSPAKYPTWYLINNAVADHKVIEAVTTPAKRKKEKRESFQLPFRHVKDPALSFKCRMILSLLLNDAHWTLHYQKTWNKPSLNYIQSKFGYRKATINKCLEQLAKAEYIDNTCHPKLDHPAITIQYTKIHYSNDSQAIRDILLLWKQAPKLKLRFSYAKHCLGISKATYFRVLSVLVSSVTT